MPDPKEKLWTAGAYREEDVPGILALIRSYYGDIDTASEAFFRWQYEANPSGRVILQVARHKETGAVMGQHVLLPMGASVAGRDVQGVLSFNALVDPTYHKQGIWSGLGDACNEAAREQGVAFSYGIPNPNSRVPMTGRLGYHDLGDLDLMVRVVRAGAAASVLPSWARGLGALGLGILRPILFGGARARGGWEPREIQAYGPEFDRLYAAFRSRYGAMIRRDAAHLAWRYTGVPGRSYRAWGAYRDGELAAYAVFRQTPFRGLDSGMLMDLAGAGEGWEDAELAVLNAGMEALTAAGAAAFFAFMVPGAGEHAVLGRAGFRRPPDRFMPQPFPLLVLPWAEESHLAPALRLGDWYFTIGDYDVF